MHLRALLALDKLTDRPSESINENLSSKLAELNRFPQIFTEQTDKVSYRVAKSNQIIYFNSATFTKKIRF